jgi:putative FmdB family regulatory protein
MNHYNESQLLFQVQRREIMPIYEYKCKSCEEIQEILQRSAEEPSLKCTNCGSADFKKLISAAFISTGTFTPECKTCGERDERCEELPCSIDGKCRAVPEIMG